MARLATSASSTSRAISAIETTRARRCSRSSAPRRPLRERLRRIYAIALDIYLGGEYGPRGCLTVMTAASEAVADPQIRALTLQGFAELDKAFAACFRLGQERGELPGSADPVVLGQLASA